MLKIVSKKVKKEVKTLSNKNKTVKATRKVVQKKKRKE